MGLLCGLILVEIFRASQCAQTCGHTCAFIADSTRVYDDFSVGYGHGIHLASRRGFENCHESGRWARAVAQKPMTRSKALTSAHDRRTQRSCPGFRPTVEGALQRAVFLHR
jgi:hypothetical protein